MDDFHKGGMGGMVKYPQNASGMAIWEKMRKNGDGLGKKTSNY